MERDSRAESLRSLVSAVKGRRRRDIASHSATGNRSSNTHTLTSLCADLLQLERSTKKKKTNIRVSFNDFNLFLIEANLN